MPTNEKSECLCHCHVHKDCGGSPDYICECACKLAEAKKEIEEWERNKGLACSHTKIPYEYTEKLLAATALISYEKGREDQRKEKCEHMEYNTYEKVTDGEILFCHECHQVVEYAESPATIESLNPSPDAK